MVRSSNLMNPVTWSCGAIAVAGETLASSLPKPLCHLKGLTRGSSKCAGRFGSSGEPGRSELIMSATIQLEKELVLRLFCCSCQGYRSVHRALQEGYWSAFRAYYNSDKKEAVRGLIERLVDLTPLPC